MCERWYGAIGRTRSSTQYLILACGLLDFHGFRGVTDFHPLLLFREEKKEKSRLFPRQPVKRHARWILYVFNQVSALPPSSLDLLSFVHREISIRSRSVHDFDRFVSMARNYIRGNVSCSSDYSEYFLIYQVIG